MNEYVSYRQLNKDYAYWIEKRWLGQQRGGQVAGLISHVKDECVKQLLSNFVRVAERGQQWKFG